MAASDKDTIYIDIDDEITGIIDKVKASNGKIVALVLPKRASVFQSIVNMKLLKRAADSEKKNLVLITSEAGLLPLAGAAGVHVAKTLTSKPEIPTGPDGNLDDDEEVDEDATEELESEPDPDKPIGELAAAGAAGAIAASAVKNKNDEVETLDLDNTDTAAGATSAAKKSSTPSKKDKKLQVPDFDRFRLMLVAGGLALVLLIIGFVFANSVLPKATILIKTDASAVNANVDMKLSTTATELNLTDNTVPAKQVQKQKTYTQTAAGTGQQNKGEKASGKVTLSLNDCSRDQVTIPAGTGLSANSQTYITQESATLSSVKIGNQCKNSQFPSFSTATVSVVAQNGGAKYNIGATNYSVTGFIGVVSGSGTAMTGGTDNIVTIVTQGDINTAKAKINLDDPQIKSDLEKELKKGNYFPITATFNTGEPKITTSVNAGDTASNVTVTEEVTYSMFGVNEDDLNTLVDKNVEDQIDTDKQKITDRGLSTATFTVTGTSPTGAAVTISTTAIAGPELNINQIKQDAAGRKPGPVKDELQTNPGVKSVEVKLSPFWVSSVPKKTSKIKVVIAKPDNSKNNSNAN